MKENKHKLLPEKTYVLLSNLVFGYSEWAKKQPTGHEVEPNDDPGTYFAISEGAEIIEKLFPFPSDVQQRVDLLEQVRQHIKQHKLFLWQEALIENEMSYLEDLLLTYAPIFYPGSIGFERTVCQYLNSGQQPVKTKEEMLEMLVGLLEKRGLRKYLNITLRDYSQIERDIVDLFYQQFREGQQGAGVWRNAKNDLPTDDEDDRWKKYLTRWADDDPRGGWVGADLVTLEEMKLMHPDGTFEWYDESPLSHQRNQQESKNWRRREQSIHTGLKTQG